MAAAIVVGVEVVSVAVEAEASIEEEEDLLLVDEADLTVAVGVDSTEAEGHSTEVEVASIEGVHEAVEVLVAAEVVSIAEGQEYQMVALLLKSFDRSKVCSFVVVFIWAILLHPMFSTKPSVRQVVPAMRGDRHVSLLTYHCHELRVYLMHF